MRKGDKNCFSNTFSLKQYDAYMEVAPLEQRLMLEYIKEKVSKIKNPTIVEIGAGTGRFTKLYASSVPGCTLLLVEPDSECRKILASSFSANIVDASAQDMHIDQQADIIVSATSFHHVPFTAKVQALQNIHRALKKDGWFLCGDNFLAEYRNLEERTTVLRRSMSKWIAEAKDEKDLKMAKRMKHLVFAEDYGGEYFQCPSAFEKMARKAKFTLAAKANCSNTHPLDMEHYFYLFRK